MSLVLENVISPVDEIAEKLRREIVSLELAPGTRLQPLRELAVRYETSYIIMRKAINRLSNEGLLSSRRGAGIYINGSLEQSGRQNDEVLTLSLLFCGIKRHIAASSTYSRLIYGMEKEADIAGCNFLMSFLRTACDNEIRNNSDGFLMLGDDSAPDLQKFIGTKPSAWVMGVNKRWGDHITYNNISVGTLAANYALNGSFKSYISLDVDPIVGTERHKTFVNCINAAGKDVLAFQDYKALLISESEQHIDPDILSLWIDKVAKQAQLPAVIFPSAELMTSAVHNLLAAKGLVVGKDITIVACRDSKVTAGINPRPIEIDLGVEEIGRLAIRHLLWKINNPDARRIVLKLEPEIKCLSVDKL